MKFEAAFRRIAPRTVGTLLVGVAIVLAAMGLAVEYIQTEVLQPGTNATVYALLDLFSLNAETTIPTWYTVILLFVAALLLAEIAVYQSGTPRQPFTRHWMGLALIFFYLSMDEGAAIHEILSDPLQSTFDSSGYLAFGWIIAAVPLVLVFALVYIRFLLHLPSTTRRGFITAAVLYVGGAVIVEAISANQWDQDGTLTFRYLAIGTVEELLEMLGVVMLIVSLLAYRQEDAPADAPRIEESPVAPLRLQRGLVFGVVGLLLGINFGAALWLAAGQPASDSPDPLTVPFYQAIVDQFTGDTVTVTHIAGEFSPDNAPALRAAKMLLDTYETVYVVSLPDAERSFALAGDTLPFDVTTLGELLHGNGVFEFVVFETATLRLFASMSQS